jgi:hypothetical protein
VYQPGWDVNLKAYFSLTLKKSVLGALLEHLTALDGVRQILYACKSALRQER